MMKRINVISLILLVILIILITNCNSYKYRFGDRLRSFTRTASAENRRFHSSGATRRRLTSTVDKETNECDRMRYPSKEIQMSFKNLVTIGDKDLVMSDFGVDQAELCAAAKKDLSTFKKHVKCIDKRYQTVFKVIAKGLKKAVKMRCKSTEWHKQFAEVAECIKDLDIYEDFHACYDKTYDSFAYILRKVAIDDQLSVTCCPTVHLTDCVHNVSLACGREAADFMKTAVWQPFTGLLNMVCKGLFDERCDRYPSAMREFDRIFANKFPKKRQGLYGLYYQIVMNVIEQR